MRKTPFALIVLLTALSLPPLEALRPDLLAQETPDPIPTFTPPDTLAEGTTVTIDGASTLEEINQVLEAGFENQYPGSDVVFDSGGTDTALDRLRQGEIDLAAIGRPLTDEEVAQGLTLVPVSRDKIAIIVSSENPFQGDLTSEQFAQIFRGEITNWSQVGGPNLPIRFVDRPAESDIRRSLSDYQLFKSQPFETGDNAVQLETDETAAVVRELGQNGISYAIASEVLDQQNVRVLSMHGTLPSNDTYPYSQPRGYAYRGEPSIPVEAFLGFATSEPGQQAVAQAKQSESASVATADILPGLIAVNPDGQTIVRATDAGQLEWLDAQGQPTGTEVDAHNGLVTGLAFTPDGQTLISTGADGTIQRSDAQGNPVGSPMQGRGGPITSLTLHPDGQSLIVGNNNGTYEKWAVDGTPVGEPVPAHEGPVRAVAFAPDGQTLLTGGGDGVVNLWNPDGTSAGKVSDAHKRGVTSLSTSPDGQLIVSGGREGSIRFWDAAGNPQGEPIAAHSDAVVDVDFSPDGQTIATLGAGGLLKQWDRNGNPIEGATVQLDSPAAAVAYTPEGNLVAGVPEGSLPIRDATGAVISSGEPTEPEGAEPPPFELPPAIADVFRQLGLVPEETWWIIPAIPVLLVLLGLIWALLGRKSAKTDKDEDVETSFDEGAAPAAGTTADTTAEEEYVADSETSGDDLIPSPGEEAEFIGDELAFLADADETYPLSTDMPELVDADETYPVPADMSEPEIGTPVEQPVVTEQTGSDKLSKARNDLAEAQRLYREGRYEEALNFFTDGAEAAEVERMKALATGVTLGGVTGILAEAMSGRGRTLAMLGRGDTALNSLNRSLELDSNLVSAWTGKGRLLVSQGRLDEALFCFDKALELDPNAGAAWAGKGQALMELGQPAEAQSCLDRAAEFGGSAEPSLPVISESPLDSPRPGQASEPDVPVDLQQAVADLPEDAEVVADGGVSVPLPPDIAAIENLPGTPDVAPAVSGSVTPGPVPVSMPGQDIPSPDEASLPQPEELDEVIQALQGSDVSHVSPGSVSPGEPVNLDPGEDVPEAASRSAGLSGNGRAIADNPDVQAEDLADLPPDLLAALQGIPADSPDSFDLPSTPAPPPLPANPRATAPSQNTSSLTISLQDERIYAVWTLDDQARAKAKQAGGEQLLLRLYDITADSEPQVPAAEQTCYELARDWYLTPPECDRTYQAEIGYLGGQGWYSLAKSQPLFVSC